MDIFGTFKESTDIADINKDNKPEISQEAQSKFDQIMGDENLFKAEYDQVKEKNQTTHLSVLKGKFESIFKADAVMDSASEIDMPHEPNSNYKVGEDSFETDDTGKTYKKNGDFLPNTEYTVNGNTYRTNEYGNKDSCDAEPEIIEEGKRNITEQRESGGEDRLEGDQGGHIIARILGGAEGEENLVPMRGTINQGDYKKMELEIKKALEEGKKVSIHIDLEYKGESSRPTKIIATYMIDGEKRQILFDNEENSSDLLDSLDGIISEEDYAQLKDEIDDMRSDGCVMSITSVKTEFGEDGTAIKVIVGVLDESAGTKSYKVFEAC